MRGRSVLLLAVLLGLGCSALADMTADVTITVTIENLGVSVAPSTWPIGTVALDSDSQNDTALVIENTGNVAEKFSLAQTKAAAWTVGGTIDANGADTYVLAARLITAKPDQTAFVDGDVVSEGTQWCNGALFGGGGTGITAGGTENMWLLFQAPTSTNSYDQQTITLTVGCQKQD